ncbi:serine/threonine kinase [Cylindrospermum sp. NIES-4074]|nr:serine/threonine kinase [Cylindrospermum sp. NIES-4074]
MKAWIPNQQLKNGRFIIQKILPGGGFGATYIAKEQPTNKLVVIKTLNQAQQEKPDFQDRQEKFVNEAMRLARCNHPHIVKVFEVIQEDGLWGMVMEYIEGEDLAVYIEEHGLFSEVEALRYIDQVGQALEYVHAQGFLHRDVKPNNIILRRGTKEAVLIDFGLAREFNLGQKRSMTGMITEGYAPIEQYDRQGNFGYYTDVYALAATLYSLLTARVPIPADYRAEADIPLPSPKAKYNPQISDKVNSAILKGMELEPQKRPQTVLEFRELLGLTPSPPDVETFHETSLHTPPKNQKVQLKSAVGMDYSQLRDLLAAEKWKSAVGMDYSRLRDLLAAEKWKDADKETGRVMLAVAKREKEGWLDVESIDNFPCEDLRSIDQLWVKYSNGRFGFSVQKRIYQSLGGTREYDREIWEAFGDAVGWRKGGNWLYYEDITFDIKAPPAHLPRVGFWGCSVFSSLASRLVNCNI